MANKHPYTRLVLAVEAAETVEQVFNIPLEELCDAFADVPTVNPFNIVLDKLDGMDFSDKECSPQFIEGAKAVISFIKSAADGMEGKKHECHC